jgi:antitoxin (DNA-binding transcriptional repressor) of toxin-antitoxin stability system
MNNYIAYFIAMKSVNTADFKNKMGQYPAFVEKGGKTQICRRNVPLAIIVPAQQAPSENKTRLGCGKGSVVVKTDLTEPALASEDWSMLKGEM